MAEIDDYESLPDDTPMQVTALAGAFAGIAEHVALYPVDSVKVRNPSYVINKRVQTWKNSEINGDLISFYFMWSMPNAFH